jgi:hypothetical protein
LGRGPALREPCARSTRVGTAAQSAVVIVAAIAGMPRVVQSPPRLTKCAAHAEHGITRIYSPCQRIPRNEGDELDGRR